MHIAHFTRNLAVPHKEFFYRVIDYSINLSVHQKAAYKIRENWFHSNAYSIRDLLLTSDTKLVHPQA